MEGQEQTQVHVDHGAKRATVEHFVFLCHLPCYTHKFQSYLFLFGRRKLKSQGALAFGPHNRFRVAVHRLLSHLYAELSLKKLCPNFLTEPLTGSSC